MFRYLGQDERMKFVFKSLVGHSPNNYDAQNNINDCFPGQINHLHDFVRETSLTTEEWMYAKYFHLPISLFISMS
jgi:hypothetical protein